MVTVLHTSSMQHTKYTLILLTLYLGSDVCLSVHLSVCLVCHRVTLEPISCLVLSLAGPGLPWKLDGPVSIQSARAGVPKLHIYM